MATYNQERTIKEYWIKVKDQYPNLSFERFEEVCKFPAYFIKLHMKSGSLVTIMVKYLGKFIVFPRRVKTELKSQEVFLKKKEITEEEYQERKGRLENFLDNFEKGYNEYELLEDDEEETND